MSSKLKPFTSVSELSKFAATVFFLLEMCALTDSGLVDCALGAGLDSDAGRSLDLS